MDLTNNKEGFLKKRVCHGLFIVFYGLFMGFVGDIDQL